MLFGLMRDCYSTGKQYCQPKTELDLEKFCSRGRGGHSGTSSGQRQARGQRWGASGTMFAFSTRLRYLPSNSESRF